jgi:hypothetical protein
MTLSERAGSSAPYKQTLGLFPRFITLDLQIEVQPRVEIRMLSKFLIIQNSVKAIWQGQNDDYQEEAKERFVASWCFVMGAMCCCGKEHLKQNNKTCVFR